MTGAHELNQAETNRRHPYFQKLFADDSRLQVEVVRARTHTVIDRHELAGRCSMIAGRLNRAGVGVGDVVLIFLQHQANLIPAFIGAQLIGAVPSFMPPISPRQDRAAYLSSHETLLRQIRPRAIIADATVAALLSIETQTSILTMDDFKPSDAADAPPIPAYNADATALLQHSSGTTGLKKGVQLSYGAVLSQLHSYANALAIKGDETVVTWLPVYHDMGLIACTLLPFVLGLPIISLDPFEWMVQPYTLLESAARAENALCWLPNFAFNHMARHASRLDENVRLDNVLAFINCSEPCRPESFDSFAAAFARHGVAPTQLQTCYAMAENVFAVTQSALHAIPMRLTISANALEQGRIVAPRPEEPARGLISCGRVIDGVEIQIRDETGASLDECLIGEIFIAGSSLFSGYFGQPDLTDQRLVNGWYGSRDLGFLREGELFICGRKEDLIIVAGRNLYSHDIEAILSGVPGLRPGRAVAFGVTNIETGTEDLIVLAETISADEVARAQAYSEAVRLMLGQQLLVTPREVLILAPDTLIKTTSGKTSRDENRRRYVEGRLINWRASNDRSG